MNKRNTHTFRNTLIVSAMLLGVATVQAEPLQPNTLYATNHEGLYAIDTTAWTTTRIGDADPAFTNVEDIAVSGNSMYGVATNMQMFEYNEITANMDALTAPRSYADNLYGLDQYQGVLYTAGHYGLARVDPATDTFDYIGSYGLGAGEEVTDLAFAPDGTLYASVTFNITYGSEYLTTIDVTTGEMNIIGPMLIYGARGLAFKDGTLYAIDSVGDVYSVDPISGLGTLLHEAVLPGAYGMTATPAGFGASGGAGGDGGSSSGGSLSWPVMALLFAVAAMRKTPAKAQR